MTELQTNTKTFPSGILNKVLKTANKLRFKRVNLKFDKRAREK